ncbi:MAG TPA: hypothetical protein VNJ01_17405 [Bacteriovoracaceae bacterium]|nr:hypothetical protein [Bacteriovoracaceae bacterium]
MKYVFFFVLVVLLVRVDFVLLQFDKMVDLFSGPRTADLVDANPTEVLVPFSEDQSIKQNPKRIFLSLLNNFRSDPSREIKELALSQLRRNPGIFSEKLDKELETEVFRLRDLLHTYNPEVASLLVDLGQLLEGENLSMLKRFTSLWMDINMESFLKAYSKSNDSQCLIATTFGDSVAAEEKNNVLYDRERALAQYISKEKADPVLKAFATSCQLVLNLHLSKIVPQPVQ